MKKRLEVETEQDVTGELPMIFCVPIADDADGLSKQAEVKKITKDKKLKKDTIIL